METTPMERFTLLAEDGFELSAMRWLPAREPRAILQISHGMAEHASRYARFAEACAAARIAVYAHDHRGHGGSVHEGTPLGHYGDERGWRTVVEDLATVNAHIRSAHPDLPVFLLGHSMGSFIVRAYLVDHAESLQGAILSATGWRLGPGNLMMKWVAEREVRKRGRRTPSKRMAKLVFGAFNLQFQPARTGFDWLSRDAREVDAYLEDPLCGFDCSGQLWADLFGGVHALEQQEADPQLLSRTLPILLIAGSKDPVSVGGFGNAQVAKRYAAAGNPYVTERRYEGGRHELVNEANRQEVFADLTGWIDAHLPIRVSIAPPSNPPPSNKRAQSPA